MYAIRASTGEISFPAFAPSGFLELARLIRLAQEGDQTARNAAWMANCRLAYSIINRFRPPAHIVADVIQEAQIGLERAISGFDYAKGFEFTTYAYRAMSVHAFRAMHKHADGCRLPHALRNSYRAYRNRIVAMWSRADWFDAREDAISKDHTAYLGCVRYHNLVNPLSESAASDQVSVEPEPSEAIERSELCKRLCTAVDQLETKLRRVMVMRYGLFGIREHTLAEIGDQFNLTRERVRQIQLKAEKELRNQLVQSDIMDRDARISDPPESGSSNSLDSVESAGDVPQQSTLSDLTPPPISEPISEPNSEPEPNPEPPFFDISVNHRTSRQLTFAFGSSALP